MLSLLSTANDERCGAPLNLPACVCEFTETEDFVQYSYCIVKTWPGAEVKEMQQQESFADSKRTLPALLVGAGAVDASFCPLLCPFIRNCDLLPIGPGTGSRTTSIFAEACFEKHMTLVQSQASFAHQVYSPQLLPEVLMLDLGAHAQ